MNDTRSHWPLMAPVSRSFVLAVFVLLACGLPAGPARAERALTASPDWRDQVIYQVITDRFANGNTANDAVEGNYNPAGGAQIHGGDFKGIEGKLDYLQQLGVTALWISPVVLNAHAEYHGYAAKDFYSIAPHMGTLAELQALVAECHRRGMYVILDIVCNHMGSLVTSHDGGWAAYKYPAGYTMVWSDTTKKYPGFFSSLSRFHNYGNVGNWSNPEQVLGQIFGLNDLRTEDPAVQVELGNVYTWLIANTDCDGYRVDTVKHVDLGFWNAWCPTIHNYAAGAGKNDFLMFGEVFDGDAATGPFTGTMAGGPYLFDSALWYGMYWAGNGVWAGTNPPSSLSDEIGQLTFYDPSVRDRLVTFLDNHDNPRFQSFGVANQDQARARAALAWLLTSRSIPCLYYGTEQDFDGGGDPYCREDMFAGQWNYGPSSGDNFRESHSLFRWTRALLAARARHDALRHGTLVALHAETSGPGLYAFRRQSASDSVVVAINSSNAPVTLSLPTPWQPGTVLGDAVQPALLDTVGAGGTLVVRVPGRGARLYESLASRATPLALAGDRLGVETTFPGHDQSLNDLRSPLHVVFDRAIDPVRLNAAFHITPPASGAWQVAGGEARFFPAAPWPAGVIVNWGLDSTLAGLAGTRMSAGFEARFRTSSYATGVTVPAGFTADRIARQNFGAPLGILPAPWLGPDVMLVADAGVDRVFTLTPGGDFGHFLGDSRWSRTAGLVRAADGRTVISEASGLYQVDARSMTTALTAASSAAGHGAMAFGGADYGAALCVSDPSGNRVTKLSAGNTLVAFAAGVNGAFGMAFGPGGAWGTSLYVTDPNLASFSAAIDGASRIVRVSAAGAVTTVFTDATLLRGAGALAFDRVGRFGGDLFVADLINERILRITSAGAISIFASGFANLAGPQCLAFGPDGALYICDAGSADSFTRAGGLSAQGQVVRIVPSVLTTDAPGGVDPVGLHLAPASPNPSAGDVALRFTLPRAGRSRLTILDLAGRRVRTVANGPLAAGVHALDWDGRGQDGRPVRAGLYFAALECGGATRTTRVVRL